MTAGRTGAPMQYFEPNFVDEALVLLDRFGSQARLLAGGTRLAFALRGDADKVGALVNLKRIKELSTVSLREQTLYVGALATAATIASHPAVRRHVPVLAQAAISMGARQLRSVATIGGNVCSGDPASDLCVALLACDAQCEIRRSSSDPALVVPIEELLRKGQSALEPGSLLVGLRIQLGWDRCAYQKMTTRRAFEMSLVAVAFCCRNGPSLDQPRVAIAGAAPTIVRAREAEKVLAGKAFTLGRARDAARAAGARDAAPQTDWRASAEFRRQLVVTLTERAIVAACGER